MTELSYTTISMILEHPHCWINKVMGLSKDYPPRVQLAFDKGKKIHRIIQDHVAGIKKCEKIDYIDRTFPIVETEDFDPKTKFTIPIDDEFSVIGFLDGYDPETRTILEIKTGTTYWGISKFINHPQRWIYALAKPEAKESYLITALSDPDLWVNNPPKTIKVPITDEDREKAKEYIHSAITLIRSGDFTTDLVDGKCTDPFCPYGHNCHFK